MLWCCSDILNVAKQMTNGVIPMGAVIASEEIHNTFMEKAGPDYVLEFAHGYTYSAHPVACAAGLAALDVLVEEQLPQRVADEAPYFEACFMTNSQISRLSQTCAIWICRSDNTGAGRR